MSAISEEPVDPTTIDSVSEWRFLIIERIDFSPEFALFLVPKF